MYRKCQKKSVSYFQCFGSFLHHDTLSTWTHVNVQDKINSNTFSLCKMVGLADIFTTSGSINRLFDGLLNWRVWSNKDNRQGAPLCTCQSSQQKAACGTCCLMMMVKNTFKWAMYNIVQYSVFDTSYGSSASSCFVFFNSVSL